MTDTDNTKKEEEKFDFDITPESFSKLNLDPANVKLYYLTLLTYEQYHQYIPNKIEENYKKLDQKYLSKLPFDYNEKVKKVREGIKVNQAFFTKVASLYVDKFRSINVTNEQFQKYMTSEQASINKLFLQLLTREWTEEGKEEREKCLTPIIQELKKYYDYENKDLMQKGVNVLSIGFRFGRILYELAKLGYNVEGNERNYQFVLITNYLFNYSKKNGECICPRIRSFCSSFTEESVTRKHYFPDVDISTDLQNVKKDGIKITKRFFEVEYNDKKDMFEAVITVFSTDEAKNIIDFTEKVNNVLKKGGVWINIGKLNNIFSNYGGFDLTWEEWKHVILKSGFEIVREETPVLPYCKIEGQSSPHTLGTIFFAAKKI